MGKRRTFHGMSKIFTNVHRQYPYTDDTYVRLDRTIKFNFEIFPILVVVASSSGMQQGDVLNPDYEYRTLFYVIDLGLSDRAARGSDVLECKAKQCVTLIINHIQNPGSELLPQPTCCMMFQAYSYACSLHGFTQDLICTS